MPNQKQTFMKATPHAYNKNGSLKPTPNDIFMAYDISFISSRSYNKFFFIFRHFTFTCIIILVRRYRERERLRDVLL